jgi:hypothetical protein
VGGDYGVKGGETLNARLGGGTLTVENGRVRGTITFRFVDEGHGKFRFGMGGKPPLTPGSYQVEEGSVVLTFWSGPKHSEIIIKLKRIKPRK